MARDRGTSAGRARSKAGGRSARATTRPRGCSFVSTSAATSPGRSIRRPATPSATSRPARCARRSRPAACATRAAAGFSEDWVPGRSLSDTHVVSPLAPRALSRRRADARRGLQLRLVQAEQDVRGRRHLQRLPRAAQRQAAAPGDGVCLQCHAADKYAAVTHHRHEAMKPAARLRVLPYAGAHLHGGRSAARSQLPHPAARSVGQARHAQCLQRLSQRQVGRMGGIGDRGLARAEPKGLPELCRGIPCGMERTRRMRRRCLRPSRRIAMRRHSRARAR